MSLLAAAARRVAMVIAPRAMATMIGGGAVAGYGTHIVDLRGELPVSQERHYSQRPEADVHGLVWHHSATKGQTIRSIAEYHVQVRQWPAIAYHYAIGWDGVIYALNDVTTASYQAQGYNRHTIGVVLVGNYQERELTPEMKASIINLSEYLKERYELRFAWLHGQSKSTLCPGKYASAYLTPLLYGEPPR